MKVKDLSVVAALVALVLIAGYTSYIHMFELARYFGQEIKTAVTTPLTVDLAMVVVSIRQRMPRITPAGRNWCRVVFIACIVASVAANVTSSFLLASVGSPIAWRVGAAIVSTWPVALLFGLDRVMMNTRIQQAVKKATTRKSAPAKAPAKRAPAKKAAAPATPKPEVTAPPTLAVVAN